MSETTDPVIYWDSSAILSVLIHDIHTERATEAARRPVAHLVSTLGHAEVCAVISRLERERLLPAVLAGASREQLGDGPWRRLALQPDWASIDQLASRWPLRGADLWHLAATVTLSRELPEVRMLTFDARLAVASAGVGLGLLTV